MGNFSRTTFDPAKRYTAVRLQQGVPLVDADWNELQDVTRNEVYDGLSVVLPNAVRRGDLILSAAGDNDLQLSPGTAVVGGRPLRLAAALRYTTQRYASAAAAAADGVQQAPPLTTPTAARSDAVYVDVFEREVGSAEDPALVNPVIGVETAVRVKREVVLRVAEGAAAPPAPPAGHLFLQIGNVSRPAGTPAMASATFDDVAPRPQQPLVVEAAVPPALQLLGLFANINAYGPWLPSLGFSTVQALKPAGATAQGIAPLSFPDGVRLRSMRIRGVGHSTLLQMQLLRVRLDTGVYQIVAADALSTPGPFDRTTNVTPGANVVDNDTYSYVVYCFAALSAEQVFLNGFQIRYVL